MILSKAVPAESSAESLEHLVLELVSPDSEIASQAYIFPRIRNDILTHFLDNRAPSLERIRPATMVGEDVSVRPPVTLF